LKVENATVSNDVVVTSKLNYVQINLCCFCILTLCNVLYVIGAMLCAIGFLSAIIVGMLDKYGVKQLGQEITLRQNSKKLVNLTLFFICALLHIMY